MMIDTLIENVMNAEGGYIDHPADQGGPTKYGITLATLGGWRQQKVSAADVKKLARSEAADIYYRRYYLAPGINRLPGPLRPLVFDMAVNHGPRGAIKLLQRTIGRYRPVAVDGVMGPRTVAAVEVAMAAMLVNALVKERIGFYRDIVKREPSQGVFLDGWERRAKGFRV